MSHTEKQAVAPHDRDIPSASGLTNEQVRARQQRGQVNTGGNVRTKSVGRIIWENTCTLFNLVMLLLGIAVALVGSYKNMLFLGVMLCNLVIGIVQELRAKRAIDRLSLLSATKATVIREGASVHIPVDEIVLDDVLSLSRGQQIAADCIVLEGACEVNESLLTGEADAIHKQGGDTLYSGSFVVGGAVLARADQVGQETYISRLSNEAKKPKRAASEIMKSLKRLIGIISAVIFPLGALLFWKQYTLGGGIKDAVLSAAAALIGMIPSGLVLLTSMVLAMSVIRLSKRRMMVQELYCIESLARVDVLCLDKTGTITEGTMQLHSVTPLSGCDRSTADDALRALCAVMDDDTPTFAAVKARYGGQALPPADRIIPFSSETKWSCAYWQDKGALFFGAPEFLLRGQMPSALQAQIDRLAVTGRVLLLAGSPQPAVNGQLPEQIKPLALLLVQDTIRKDAQKTFRFFAKQGVSLKVISGDNPLTVSAIARRVGLAGAEKFIDVSQLDGKQLIEAVEEYTVFGRVSPKQKQLMVKALQAAGHTVAMTGDGVNDVLALKEADCGIAMASGSDAARNIAHLVLLDSNFEALPDVVYEGRRSINNLQRSATLFLVKTIFSIGLSLLFLFLPLAYPFEPIQLTLASALTIGLPSFVLALEANRNRVQGHFLRNVTSRAIPSAAAIVFNVALLSLIGPYCALNEAEISTLCVLLTMFTGLMTIYRLSVPFTTLRKILFAVVCAGLLAAVFFFPDFFSLVLALKLVLPAAVLFADCWLIFSLLCTVMDARTRKKEEHR